MPVVTLSGGPYHGCETDVEPTRRMFTWESVVDLTAWDVDGRVVLVPVLEQHSYRRVSETEFEYCDTQTGVGDAQRILKGDR